MQHALGGREAMQKALAEIREILGTAKPRREFRQDVVDIALLHGWRVHEDLDGDDGFPGVVLQRGSRLLFLELEGRADVLSPPQRTWLGALAAVDEVEAFVWRPGDLDEIEAVLTKGDEPEETTT